MRPQNAIFIAVFGAVLSACAPPDAWLEVWEWRDQSCDQAPCWGRVLVVDNQVTYERDGGLVNSGTLTDVGLEELEIGLAGLCSSRDDAPASDRRARALVDCDGESRWVTYDKDAPPEAVQDLDALMADVIMTLQNCRPRESTMPDHGCDRLGE